MAQTTVKALLKRYGRSFAADLGIDAEQHGGDQSAEKRRRLIRSRRESTTRSP